MVGSVLAVSCRHAVAACEARGVEVGELLSAVGLTREALEAMELRLEPSQVVALWRLAYEHTQDPALALHVAEALPRGAYRVVEYLAASADTIGQAYEALARYFAVVDADTELTVERERDGVRFGPRHSRLETPLPATEFMLAACYLRVREMVGVAFSPTRVDFVAPEPAHAPEVQRVFDCPVRWQADRDSLWFSQATWSTRTASADRPLHELLAAHAQGIERALPRDQSLSEQLGLLLLECWRYGEPTLPEVARQLGYSPRSLQRHLREAGHRFAELVDQARRSTTLKWLQDPGVPLAEVAFVVHFSDQAALTHAVKRWTGMTPREYRQRLRR
jgi:AraC-like DNA-binding protein